jgi:hypothetical protein
MAYKLIGRVAAEWSRLEHALDRIIWTLAGTLYLDGACITSQLLGATARYKVICAQLNLRATQDSLSPASQHSCRKATNRRRSGIASFTTLGISMPRKRRPANFAVGPQES